MSMSNRSMNNYIYECVSSTIKKINLRFSYTFITFGINIHVVYIVTSNTLSLPETSIHNCCCRRRRHLVVGFFFFSFVMLLSLSLRLLVRYRFFLYLYIYIHFYDFLFKLMSKNIYNL